MTDQFPPPPPPSQPGNYGDAKAQAKAAAAYAKAQRPWYKKKRWIGLIAIVVIGIAAAAGGGGGDDKGKQTVADAPVTNSQSGDGDKPADEPTVAKPDNSSKGKGAITWGNWEVQGRLQVSKEEFTGDFAVVTRVKNTGDDADTGLFTVTILKGTEILGTANCSTPEIDSGAVGTANCISTDAFKAGYTEVTIEDSF